MADSKTQVIEQISIDSLIPYARNTRTHSEAQVAQIAASIREFGFTNPVLVKADRSIIAGHGRVMAAQKLGIEKVPCLVLDYLTDVQAKALAIADNKIPLNAGWDAELLKLEMEELKEAGVDMGLLAFADGELQTLFEGGASETVAAQAKEDDYQAPPIEEVETFIKRGDLIDLGRHRLLCGDSCNAKDVGYLMDGRQADLVITDPPYGVSAIGGRSLTAKVLGIEAIENDDLRGESLQTFLRSALGNFSLRDKGCFYVCYDHKTQYEFVSAFRDIGWSQRNTIVWNKNVFGLGNKGYRPKFELIAFGHVGESYEWYGGNDQSDVWDIPRPTDRPGNHPTPKPIELVTKALINSSQTKEIVVDAFLGSGTTLIACEQLGRTCYGMELEPKYCQVIIERYVAYCQKEGKPCEVKINGEVYEPMPNVIE